ncbi:hypothetical protein PT2222_240125 [Paraburkholderia tropica]
MRNCEIGVSLGPRRHPRGAALTLESPYEKNRNVHARGFRHDRHERQACRARRRTTQIVTRRARLIRP